MKKLKLKAKSASLKVKAFEFYTMGLLFSFCIFCSSASPGYAQNSSKQLSTQVNKRQPHLLIAKSPTTDLGRKLWQARISSPKDRDSSKSKNELYQIIRQINSIEFKPQDQTPKPLIVVEPIQKVEPNEISSDTEMPQEQEPNKIEHKLPYKQVTDQTLQIFKSLSQHPGQLHSSFELAEILFNSRRLREAAKCYQEALNRMAANEDNRHEERAWILFQIGNCLRNTDRPAAIEMYRQLIAEYPDSPWADLAKARSELIDWYQQDKPGELVAENRF